MSYDFTDKNLEQKICLGNSKQITTNILCPMVFRIVSLYGRNLIVKDFNTIHMYDPESTTCLKVFEGHTKYITSVIIYKTFIISSSEDCTIRIWDMDSGNCIGVLEGHTGSVNRVLTHNDKLISVSHDDTIRIWDIASGTCINVLEGHTGFIDKIVVHNGFIISCSWDETLRIWDIETGLCCKILYGHKDRITGLFTYENKLISMSCKKILIWDLQTFSNIKTIHTTPSSSADCYKQNNILIYVSTNYKINMLDLNTDITTDITKIFTSGKSFGQPLYIYDKYFLISTKHHHAISIWDIETLDKLITFQYHTGSIKSAIMYENNIISSSYDKTIRITPITLFPGEQPACRRALNSFYLAPHLEREILDYFGAR